MTKDEALKLALEALELTARDYREQRHAITAIREALAQPEHSSDCALLKIPSKDCDCQPQQEPVAWLHEWLGVAQLNMTAPEFYGDHWKHTPLYTIPPQEQRCYCGNIYRLGVVHRESSFCDEHPRKPLKIEELPAMRDGDHAFLAGVRFAEQAHGIKE